MVNGAIIISSLSEVRNVRVLDMSGRVVFEGRSNNIEVSKNGSAMYYLEIETTQSLNRLKVINSGM